MKSKKSLEVQLKEKQQELSQLPEDAHWQDEYAIQSEIVALREAIEKQD